MTVCVVCIWVWFVCVCGKCHEQRDSSFLLHINAAFELDSFVAAFVVVFVVVTC